MFNFIWQDKDHAGKFRMVDIPKDQSELGMNVTPGIYICAFRTRDHAQKALDFAQMAHGFEMWQVVEVKPGTWIQFRDELRSQGVRGLMVINPGKDDSEFIPLNNLL